MRNFREATDGFFLQLEIHEDKHGGTHQKGVLQAAVNCFLDQPAPSRAEKIYELFFTMYWTGIQEKENPFILQTVRLKSFEEQIGPLLAKHRDHYVHSAFVFCLGLAIYITSRPFQEIFDSYVSSKDRHPHRYGTRHEEFFYRWGISSLYHDIGYPLELITKATSEYADFLTSYTGERSAFRISKAFSLFRYGCITTLKPTQKYKDEYYSSYSEQKSLVFNLLESRSVFFLLLGRIRKDFGLSQAQMFRALRRFYRYQNDRCYIDHGLLSSIISAKWFHYLVFKTNWDPSYFYKSVVCSASAILMHTMHYCVRDFTGGIAPEHNPIAFLLILCDELQDWCRTDFSPASMTARMDAPLIRIGHALCVSYPKGTDAASLEKKKRAILDYVDMSSVFRDGLTLTTEDCRD